MKRCCAGRAKRACALWASATIWRRSRPPTGTAAAERRCHLAAEARDVLERAQHRSDGGIAAAKITLLHFVVAQAEAIDNPVIGRVDVHNIGAIAGRDRIAG